MRKYSLFLFVLVLVMLTACGTDDTPADQGEINEEQDVDVEKIADEGEDDKKESSSVSSPTDALGVFDAVGEAMNQVTGIALEGENESHVEMSGLVTMDETNEVTGEVTFNPYVEHINYQTTSELFDITDKSEYYLNDEAIYMDTTAVEGWVTMPMFPNEFGSVLTEAQFKNFSKHHDQFELSEENGNYLLSFEGDGDIYKDVIYGGLRDTWGEEGYEAMTTSIVEGTSGSYQLIIDKQTFHIVSSSRESETVDDDMIIENSFSYEYSNYNEVDDVVVPEDVIENAGKAPGME